MTITTPTTPLETGTQPSTPAGDTLLLDFVRAEAAAYAALAVANGGRACQIPELGLAMADSGSPCPFGNLAHLHRPLDPAEAPAVGAALRDFYRGGAGGPYLVFSPWSAPGLGDHHLTEGGHPPFMVRPAGGTAPVVPGLRIAEVTTPELLTVFERVLVEAYPVPELAPFGTHPRLWGDDVLGSGWKLFLGFEGDRPVATAGGFVTDRIVAVEAVSTLSECRGRGYGAALTAAAMLAAPDRPSALVASDLGRTVYERLGYLPILRYTLWIGARSVMA